ncbi:GNAT family N-acetyltransferase, partial [Myxococcota bacterium]|nr:GNAT family N-acetyltransferase [Myxococcota bacterium]
MAIVRIMRPEDIDAVSDLTARVFGDPDDHKATSSLLQRAYRECPFMPPELCWVGEEAGAVVVKWQILDLTMRVAGVPI